MDYQKAKEIRGKSLSSLITDKIVGGEGVMSSIRQSMSERSKARATGIKEKFDPLNIVKALTGGSRVAPAILGRLTGRSPEAIRYFAGDPKKKQMSSGISSEDLQGATETLGSIYALMVKIEEEKKQDEKNNARKQKTEQKEEDDRNKVLIKALTARMKPKKRAKEEKKQEQEQKNTEQKQEQTQKKTEKKQEGQEKKKEKEVKKEQEVKKETIKKAEEKKPEIVPPKEVKPKPTAKPEAPPAVKPPTAAKIPPVVVSGTKGLVLGALVAAGYSKQAQANVMANVDKESNFKPRSEELGKYSAKTLFKLYGPPGVPDGQPADGKNKVRFQSMSEAQAVVSKGPEAVGDVIYGGRMGNDKPGDGFKYRGRGFIQITGKENYDKVGKLIGVDLVNNPDLANDPEVAAKIVPAFFKLRLKKPEDLENIDAVNKAVGSASVQSREDRKKLAVAYAAELNTGNQLSASSTENRELKKNMTDSAPAPVIVNNNNTTQTKKQTPMPPPAGDDRSAYAKKVN
jgi:predicted chitinase